MWIGKKFMKKKLKTPDINNYSDKIIQFYSKPRLFANEDYNLNKTMNINNYKSNNNNNYNINMNNYLNNLNFGEKYNNNNSNFILNRDNIVPNWSFINNDDS